MAMREERRVVTALFADLVGSTPLGERLDPEELKLVVGEAVAGWSPRSRLRRDGEGPRRRRRARPVRRPRRARGRPRARDPRGLADRRGHRRASPTRWPRRGASTGFAVRVGVETGPGRDRARSARGPRRVRAARRRGEHRGPTADRGRAGHGPRGTPRTRLVEPLFDWGTRRSVTLEGQGRPRPASRCAAVTGVAARAPAGADGVSPARRPRRASSAAAARRGRRRPRRAPAAILFVTGEPGIGKTPSRHGGPPIVRPRRTPRTGAPLWLEGRCVSYGESLPYWPFRDLLRAWLGVAATSRSSGSGSRSASSSIGCSATAPTRSSRTSARCSS